MIVKLWPLPQLTTFAPDGEIAPFEPAEAVIV